MTTAADPRLASVICDEVDAVRAAHRLLDQHGSGWSSVDDHARVDRHPVVGDVDRERVQTTWGRPAPFLTEGREDGAVTCALEPAGTLAERHSTAEVWAFLVERQQPGVEPGQEPLVTRRDHRCDTVVGDPNEPSPGLGNEDGRTPGLGNHVVDGADVYASAGSG